MPELPDLQVFSENLNKMFQGKTLQTLKLTKPANCNVSSRELSQHLEGKKLVNVYRVGKQLYFNFGESKVLSVHLMLKGILKSFEEANPHKYTILELQFDDLCGVAITDIFGKAKITFNPDEPDVPDALSKELNYGYLRDQIKLAKSNIKKFLVDQSKILGIGNAYADEILWELRISPLSSASAIPDEQVRLLAAKIKAVLKDAEKKIKKLSPGIIGGEIRDFMKIHHPDKTHSPTGFQIRQMEMNGRKTYYTDEQIEY